MPLKLAQHLAFFTVVLIYCTAIPGLLLFVPFYFFLHFWIDKWLLIRHCKLPPKYETSLNDRANNIVGFALMMHIFSSIWVFTTPEIFPSAVKVYDHISKVKYYYVAPMGFIDRILDPRVSTFVLLFFATLFFFYVIEPLLIELVKACCFKKPRRGQRIRKGTMRAYSIESIEQMNKYGDNVFTYDMMKLKKYRRALLLLNQLDIDEADEFFEREQPRLDNFNIVAESTLV